ncbi:unnamed protein product [Rotaria magnacalcarata]|uniref:Uncharacterized protein n=1 Tax=Rotaria magnacalcarata TaxID=392030 RepID=A0A814JI77_9BILA|nr:unnamed protein product [Rotaria magnacalcarata]CAF1617421.1 unnamed protein product [Rotaria magnacalcarata]CAF2140850.1 unnamed protein product [Rotaria magnacalcarata]CAF2153373.1 unnamed protein product [Rotaria magnacalcarata]CAF2267175.1 unnamed protein product [Rotaria magnacalcarata]
MGILKGKDSALSHIEQSKTSFLATLSEVEQGATTHTMPPKDHYTLKFKRETLKNLKGRVYETMKQYAYEQLGESIPAFLNNKEADDSQVALFHPTKPAVPTVGHQYVACIYEDLKIIDYLIEIDWSEVDELVKVSNARRKSVV